LVLPLDHGPLEERNYYIERTAGSASTRYRQAKMLVKHLSPGDSDSVKRRLSIGYAADLTPVVAAKEAEASWNARGMAETV
jgi:hypothetical protein